MLGRTSEERRETIGRLTRLAVGAMTLATLIAGGVTTALPAGAYSNDGHMEVYQIGISVLTPIGNQSHRATTPRAA